MSVAKARPGTRRFGVHSTLTGDKARARRFACEVVEGRVLLSTATFAAPLSVSVTGASAPIFAAQFNGSANPIDLAVATPTAVQILTGHSNGSFSAGSSIALPANPAAQSPFLVGDFAGNGSDDIVLNSYDSASGQSDVTYETSNGNGTFTAGSVTTIANSDNGFIVLSGAVGDFNGDGKEDLALVGRIQSSPNLFLSIALSNGDGTFTENREYPITGSNSSGNISNEQILVGAGGQIFINDGSGQELDVFTDSGNGTFTQLTPAPLAASAISLIKIAGQEDVVTASAAQVSLLVNQGNGTFQPDAQGSIALAANVSALATGDFNLDGSADIITNNGILFGNGDGTFNATPQALPVAVVGGPNALVAVDILGNKRPGIVGLAAAGNAVVSAVNQSLAVATFDLVSSNNPAAPGTDIQFTVTLSAADADFAVVPSGNVTFFDGTNTLGMAQLAGGTATFDAGSSLPGGDHSITVGYGGDANFAAGTSAPLVQILAVPTITTVVSSENPALSGDDVTFTAMVSGNDGAGDVPGGNVEFLDNGVDLGAGTLDSTGKATYQAIGSLAAGSHSITAQYQGDPHFSPSVSDALSETVNQPGILPAIVTNPFSATIVAGAPTHGKVSITLVNQTSGVLAADKIMLFASLDGSINDASAVTTLLSKHGIPIKAGQTKKLNLAVKSFPAALATGAYKLILQVGSSAGQNSNSQVGASVNIAAPFVQYEAANGIGILKPNPAKIGKTATLTLALVNVGNIPTTGAVEVDIGLSATGDTPATVDLETVTLHPKIKPTHTALLHLRIKIPSTVTAGNYNPVFAFLQGGGGVTLIGRFFKLTT